MCDWKSKSNNVLNWEDKSTINEKENPFSRLIQNPPT